MHAQLVVRQLIKTGEIDPESAMHFCKVTSIEAAISHLALFGEQDRLTVPSDTLRWPTIEDVPPRRYFNPNNEGIRSAVIGRVVNSVSKELPFGQVIEFPTVGPIHSVLFSTDETLRQDYLLSTATSVCWGVVQRKGDTHFPIHIWLGQGGRRMKDKLNHLKQYEDSREDIVTRTMASRGLIGLGLPQEFYSADLTRKYGGRHVVLFEDLSELPSTQLEVIARAAQADPNVHLIAAADPEVRNIAYIKAALMNVAPLYTLYGRLDYQAGVALGGERLASLVTKQMLPPHQILVPIQYEHGVQYLRAWIPNPGV